MGSHSPLVDLGACSQGVERANPRQRRDSRVCLSPLSRCFSFCRCASRKNPPRVTHNFFFLQKFGRGWVRIRREERRPRARRRQACESSPKARFPCFPFTSFEVLFYFMVNVLVTFLLLKEISSETSISTSVVLSFNSYATSSVKDAPFLISLFWSPES